MKRDKQFWLSFTPEERIRLWHYERDQNRFSRMGGYLPDDSSECVSCGDPMLGSGQCSRCLNDFISLLKKGEGK